MSTQNPKTGENGAHNSAGEGAGVKYTMQQQLQLQQLSNYK